MKLGIDRPRIYLPRIVPLLLAFWFRSEVTPPGERSSLPDRAFFSRVNKKSALSPPLLRERGTAANSNIVQTKGTGYYRRATLGQHMSPPQQVGFGLARLPGFCVAETERLLLSLHVSKVVCAAALLF